jgi:CubicO group peptidase (beta-lactamase class C family)
MSNLRDILQTYVSNGSVPGAVGLIARGDRVEVQAVGCTDTDGTYPMARDSIFRIASITKPITAAAAMMLVEDGQITLDDPVGPWLPELASPAVVRTPAGPLRPLTSRSITSGSVMDAVSGAERTDRPGMGGEPIATHCCVPSRCILVASSTPAGRRCRASGHLARRAGMPGTMR